MEDFTRVRTRRIKMTKTPYELITIVQQQNSLLDLADPEFVEEEHFITAACDLMELTEKLYLTSRPEEFDISQTVYLLSSQRPNLQKDGNEDWKSNREVALLGTTIEDDDGTLYAKIAKKIIEPEVVAEFKAKVYQLK